MIWCVVCVEDSTMFLVNTKDEGWMETEMEIVSGWIGDDGCKVKHEIGTTTHHPLEVLQVQS